MSQTLAIIDLEATCCERDSFPREEMEIIEIGAVAVKTTTGEVMGEFSRFVRPTRHPRLTAFCCRLTSIRQDDVDAAETFPVVMKGVAEWLARYPGFVFASWGAYDRKQFLREGAFHKVPWCVGQEHRNLKSEFRNKFGDHRGFGMARALRHLGLELEGTHHRGIDDARNIARIYRAALLPGMTRP